MNSAGSGEFVSAPFRISADKYNEGKIFQMKPAMYLNVLSTTYLELPFYHFSPVIEQ